MAKGLPTLPVTKYSDAARLISHWMGELKEFNLRDVARAARVVGEQELILSGNVVAPLFQFDHLGPYARGMVIDAAFYAARAHLLQVQSRECEHMGYTIARELSTELQRRSTDEQRELMAERSSAAYKAASRASVRRSRRPAKV